MILAWVCLAVFALAPPHADETTSIEVGVSELKAEERNLIDDLDDLVEQRLATENDLAKQTRSLVETQSEVTRENRKLAEDQLRFARLRGELRRRAVRSFRFVRASAAQFIISSEGPLEAVRRLGFVSRLVTRDFALFDAAQQRQAKIVARKQNLSTKLADIEHTQQQLQQTQKMLSVQKDAIDRTLLEVREQRTHHEQTLYDVREAEARLQREKGEAQAVRDPFSEQRGQLQLPAAGAVVRPFGRQVDNEFGTVTFHSGWQIGASKGAEVQVVAAGRVVQRVYKKGLGEIVVVKHSELYHSVYSGLSDVFRRPGDELQARSALGRVQNDRGIYFEMRRAVTPEDPTTWLRPSSP